MNKYLLVICLLLLSIDVCAKEKKYFSDDPRTYKLACLRLEHRINVIKGKLRRGYTFKQGKRLKQQLEYYLNLKKYYKCE